MPCMMLIFDDPASQIVQGDEMLDALVTILPQLPALVPYVRATGEPSTMLGVALWSGAYGVEHSDFAQGIGEVLFDPLTNPAISNFQIPTPDGGSLNVLDGDTPLTGAQFLQTATARWALVLQTQDASGVAIANVRVLAMEVGQLAVGGASVQAEGVSDGSGNLTLVVPLNTAYLAVAYVSGAPDRSGTSAQTIAPTAQ